MNGSKPDTEAVEFVFGELVGERSWSDTSRTVRSGGGAKR
jgi:hypothetical protein